MRRRVVRVAVAVALSAGSVVAMAGPAWAPRVHRDNGQERCKDGAWRSLGYRNQGDCISQFNRPK